jgi:hypothetical protein
MRSEARTGACALGAFMLTSLCLRTEAAAATIDCGPKASVPCTFGITDPGIQLSNGAIKFQARVTQGKNTVSDGEISQVSVELVDGASKVMCTQTFGKVAVRNSILNLDFQPSGCALDNVVAKTSDLAFKLVLAGSALKPIPIGTVPYALKSNYAVKAQETHRADVAAQAHYAHRITADRQTLATPEIGTGYFDFFTPGSGGNLYDDTQYQSYLNDGFMQWTPVQGQSSLHVCAKGVNDDKLAKLDALYLESKSTTAHGVVVVDPPQVAGTQVVGLTVTNGGASVTGFTTLASGALVGGGLRLSDSGPSGTPDLVCNGDAQVDGALTVGLDLGTKVRGRGTLTVSGDAEFQSEVSFLGPVNLGAPMASTGTSGPAVSGTSVAHVGVYGESTNANGVKGLSTWSSGVYGSTSSTNSEAAGVKGESSSAGYGVAGSSPKNAGVFGSSTSSYGVKGSSSSNTGVFGTTSSTNTDSAGVKGESSSGFGYGVAGFSTNNAGVFGSSRSSYGVKGSSSSDAGVFGTTSSTDTASAGVKGVSSSGSGYGVVGSSLYNAGVFGSSFSYYGMQGETSNPKYAAVYGKNTAPYQGVGVQGLSESGSGVRGETNTGGAGVQGISSGGYGGSFSAWGDKAPLHLGARDSLPSTGELGDLAVLSDGTLRFYNGTAWKTVTLH